MIKLLMAGLLAATQTTPPPVLVPAPTCLTREQVGDIAIAVLPFIIESARSHCGPHLPPNAFIATERSAAMATAIREVAAPRRAAAATAFRIMAGRSLPRGISDRTLGQMMGETMAGELMPSLDAQVCRNLDALLDNMSLLPPERIGSFLGAFFALALRAAQRQNDPNVAAGDRRPSPEICPV